MKNSKRISLDEFIHRVRDASDGEFTLAESRVAIESFVQAVVETMKNVEYISLEGFGSIGGAIFEERLGRDFTTNEIRKIPARARPKYEACQSLKNEVSGT